MVNVHYHHSPNTESREEGVDEGHEYSLLTNDDAPPPSYSAMPKHVNDTAFFVNHDYDEPYIEPASQEEELMLQFRRMAIPIIAEENLKYVFLEWEDL